MTAELLLSAMAGLGLLFYGLEMVTGNLSAMAGESMRRGITAVSKNAGLAMLFGTFLGVVLQSARSAVSVMASFVQADIIDVRRAMRVARHCRSGVPSHFRMPPRRVLAWRSCCSG